MIRGMKTSVMLGAAVMWLWLGVTSCHDDADGDGQTTAVAPDSATPFQMMVVFAPGQLGDKGYADNVMEGINRLGRSDTASETDSMNVGFIATYDQEDLVAAVSDWAATPADPFHHGDYQRRLLVLTEPYLVSLLYYIAPVLRPADEVLVLKVNEDDVQMVAERYGLGARIHGLNISAAASARNYCAFMRQSIEYRRTWGEEVPLDTLAFFRLYDSQTMVYRDSIYETLHDEFGSTSTIVNVSLSDEVGAGIYSVEYGVNVIEAAFNIANVMKKRQEESGTSFAFVDLGAGNAGWDYFLLGKYVRFQTLMLDAQDAVDYGRFCIQRQFGEALLKWSKDWMRTPVGDMPRQTSHCNGQYCDDNFSFISE